MEQVLVLPRTVHQVPTQIQQHLTHQAHWEKTVQATLETEVVQVPAEVVLTEVEAVTVVQETTVVPVVHQDQTQRQVAQNQMVLVLHQAEQEFLITHQASQLEANLVLQEETAKQ